MRFTRRKKGRSPAVEGTESANPLIWKQRNNKNNKFHTDKIGAVAIELVLTDLRHVSAQRCLPFFQITTCTGHVVARSAVLVDCVMDAPWPTVWLSWKDLTTTTTTMDNHDHYRPNQVTQDVLQQPLLITVYDFRANGRHEILGQVRSTNLLELAQKTADLNNNHNSNNNNNNNNRNNGMSLSDLVAHKASYALIWQDMAVMGDLYVEQVQFLEHAPKQQRRTISQTHFQSRQKHSVPTPTGIPAPLLVEEEEEDEEKCDDDNYIIDTNSSSATNNHSQQLDNKSNTKHDDDNQTNLTESLTECSSFLYDSPLSAHRKQPPAMEPNQDGHNGVGDDDTTKTQSLIQATVAVTAKLKQKRQQIMSLRGNDAAAAHDENDQGTASPPHKSTLYVSGRSQSLLALADERRAVMQQKRLKRNTTVVTP